MVIPASIIEIERQYTSDEFEMMPEFDAAYELLDGRIIEKSMPGDEHGTIVANIITALILLDPQRKLGKWWTNTSVKLDNSWEPIPDFMFVRATRVQPVTKKGLTVVPDLVVEVHSPHDLDTKKRRLEYLAKIKQYQAFRVAEVWVIKPDSQSVEIYHPDAVEPVKVLGIDGELEVAAIIPGFKLKVADLFK